MPENTKKTNLPCTVIYLIVEKTASSIFSIILNVSYVGNQFFISEIFLAEFPGHILMNIIFIYIIIVAIIIKLFFFFFIIL